MKKNIYIALAVAMMGFTACSEDTFDYINKDTYHPAPEVVPYPEIWHSIFPH